MPAAATHNGSAPCSCDRCGDAERDTTQQRNDEPELDAESKPKELSVPLTATDDPRPQSDSRATPGTALIILAAPTPTTSSTAENEPSAQATPARQDACSPNFRDRKKSWWIDWATLLRRVYGVHALACRCGGRLRFVEVVIDREKALAHLERLGLDAATLPIARSRDPADDFIDPPSPDC